MIVYTAIVHAKPGCEDEVEQLYRTAGERLAATPGFKGRHVLRSQPGAYMQAAITYVKSQGREVPQHETEAHDHGPEPIRFVSIEMWETPEARVAFGLSPETQAHSKKLAELLAPEHSHDFYQDIGGH